MARPTKGAGSRGSGSGRRPRAAGARQPGKVSRTGRATKDAAPRGRVAGTAAPKRSNPTRTPQPAAAKAATSDKDKRARAAPVAALRDRLWRGEEWFRSLVETVAAPILLLSPSFVVLELNQEAERLYGTRRRHIIGRGYFAALDPERSGGLTEDELAEVAAGRPMRGIEGRVRRRDGTERVLLWNATRLHGADGTTLGVIAVAQDITDRKRAEEALREREARLSTIIATAPDAIITIDERGIVQSFSAAAERVFGYQASEVIGRNVKLLMPSPDRERHDGYLARYQRTGEKRIIGIGREVKAERKDGTVFPIELAVGEVLVGATRIFTGFIRDITARTRMEQELRQAQKMEAVGRLTGGLAHDFNNMLTVITGNLEMLERRLADADDREILDDARAAADLGAKLANRLLAFGRRQPINPEPIDLGVIVGDMADLLRRSLSEAIGIETRLAPGLDRVLADPGQMETVLLNLAINARDAMPDGGRLTIETANVELAPGDAGAPAGLVPGRYVVLSVADTGRGMSPEIAQHAFDPFFTTREPGVDAGGLGLSIVYSIVTHAGGRIRLDSELSRGTVARVYLPAWTAPQPEATQAAPAGDGAGAGETILVVEDDARVRRVSVRRLEGLGYRVVEAESGATALAILEGEGAIDLLFTDVIMPGGMTGVELARRARAHRPDLKVLFTSGYADAAVVEGGRLTANADWLGKPYSDQALAAKLRGLFGR